MNPFPNPPSSEPTRVEIQYRLTPEQRKMQRTAQRHVRGIFRVMGVIMVVWLVASGCAGSGAAGTSGSGGTPTPGEGRSTPPGGKPPTPTPKHSPIVHLTVATRSVANGDLLPTVATCPAGEVALSGGWLIDAHGNVKASQRSGNGWGISVLSVDGANVSVTTKVLCLGGVPGASAQEVSQLATANPKTGIRITATCPAGSVVVGGGFVNDLTQIEFLDQSSDVASSWEGGFINNDPTISRMLSGQAECLIAPGAHTTQVAVTASLVPGGTTGSALASCPAGLFLSGGGLTLSSGLTYRILGQSPTVASASAWETFVFAQDPQFPTSYAMCLSFS